MQNWQQQPPGYQRPGSTASFAGAAAPPPPPPYGGYQSTVPPPAQSQWAPPPQPQNQTPTQQWNQPQQATGGYNPGVYGAMPGGYGQGQQAQTQTSNAYPSQQQDVPPPPPPKPLGFQQQQTQQQNQQNWSQQPAYAQQPQQSFQAPQQNAGFAPQGQQGGYTQQGGFQNQTATQQPYNSTAPPPPSQTPGGSYFPPTQSPVTQGRPQSIYGADQAGTFSSSSTAVGQQPPSSIMSPNEQQPAYIPPSLTGQGVQSYMPANTNPMPGVYVPPPPDIPAWQQAQHAPLQGGKKFKYTKPMVDPSFQTQGYQGIQQMQQQAQFGQQPQQAFGQPAQNQFHTQEQIQQQGQYGQPAQNQFPAQVQPQPQGQFGQPVQTPLNQFSEPVPQQQNQFPQQQISQYNQTPQGQPVQTPQQFQQQPNQWQPTPPVDQGYGQQQPDVPAPYTQQTTPQQAWQPGHQTQVSIIGQQQYSQGQGQGIQAPKPINGQTSTTPPNFVTQPSPHSQPVSPVHNRNNSLSFGSGQSQTGLGRTGSVSSIALGAIHAQRAGGRVESPKPPTPKIPTPPPPRDDKTKFSALGSGGPSDWEHFGNIDEEIDDEEFFGAKKDEKKDEAAHSDSVELPAHVPSPPATQDEWPSPPTQTVPLNLQRRDTYQPTPPPPKSTGTPAQGSSSQPPQQSFVMGDVMVAPMNTQSPQPAQIVQPPPAQQGFVMDDGGWAPPKQDTPAQQQQQHQAPPAQQGFVMDDGGWAAQSAPAQPRQLTPTQQQHQPPPANTSFVMNDGGWGTAQQPPAQQSGGWGAQTNENHVAELKAKDEAYERLRADMEKQGADLRSEMEKLKTDIDTARSHTESEKNVLNEQIESMKTTAGQAKASSDTLLREKDSTIERLKEDAEGKDDAIKEKDAMIADLRQKVKEKDTALEDLKQKLMEKDTVLEDLTQQLEAEKAKEPPKPTPADLVSDINPWYASSLERYIAMLRGEASEPLVEDKIKTFMAFLKAESGIRGLEYYSAPPAPAASSAQEPVQHIEPSVQLSRGTSNASIRKQDLNVQVPQEPPGQDDVDYSPGGRPIIVRKPTIKSNESIPTQQSFSFSSEPSAHSTATLTPTSSNDDDFTKTPTPMQSPPEEQPQPQYKPYVPPSVTQADSANSLHRQSMSFATPSPIAPLQTSSSGKITDEIFFEGSQPSSKPASRPTTSTSKEPDHPVLVPAPLFTQPPTTSTPTPLGTKDPTEILSSLLATEAASPTQHPELEEIRTKLSEFPSAFSFITDLTTAYEKSAALTRKKIDDARRKRQENSEAETDDLFNANEISYADIGAIEDEFKEKERDLKAAEDREEYMKYISDVFDRVYDSLQGEIKTLMELWVWTERLLQASVSGEQRLEGGDKPSTLACLELLKQVHTAIELRHEKVVQAVAERDRRYKKTEIQPLYAAGNIAKMKSLEKHFENAERQAVLRAKSEKAERVGDMVKIAEEVVVAAVGIEQQDVDGILKAIRDLPENASEEGLLGRAREFLFERKASSKALLELFNKVEIELNTTVLEAEIAQAKVENAGPDRVKELEQELVEGEKKLREEFERRVGVLEQDREEIEMLIKEKGGKGVEPVLSEEDEIKRRKARALEEAKKRNGDF